MNTQSRIKIIENMLSKIMDEKRYGIPIVDLTPEQKINWPKRLPYPIMGGLSIYEMPENIK